MKYKISGTVDLQPLKTKIIYRAMNQGANVGAGAKDIIKNIEDGLWSFDDVKGYKLFLFQFMQRAMMEDEPSTLQAAEQIMRMFPDSLNISAARWDLLWFGRDTVRKYPERSWGSTEFPVPNKSFGSTPRQNLRWAEVDLGEIKQNNINKDLTFDNLTNPYRIEINNPQGNKWEWLVRENQQDISNENWLYHIGRALVKWINMLPYVQGLLIGPIKIQWAANLDPWRDKFSDWITNVSDIRQWGQKALFDYCSFTVLDVFEASWKFVKIIKQLDPRIVVVYDPFTGHVPWGQSLIHNYEQQWRQKYGTDPKLGFERNLLDIVDYVDYCMFPTEELNAELRLGAEYLSEGSRNYIRSLPNWCIYPPKNQYYLN